MLDEQLIPSVATEVATTFLKEIAVAVKSVLASAATKVRVRLDTTFSKYIQDIASKYARAKSFVHRDSPQYLYDFYVPLDLVYEKRIIPNPGATELFAVSRRAVVVGGGGSGKSTFLRHLLLSTLEARRGVPIFIELRNLRSLEYNIITYITFQLGLHELPASEEFVDKALQAGRFVLFLDGFDELPIESRTIVSDQILDLADRYTKNVFVVSSRAEDICQSWNSFLTFHAAPLTLEKAVLVVEQLKYDVDVSTRFIGDLRKGMYEKHKSFLSNPLLLAIMLVTYRANAEIPESLHNFYSQAFDALFSMHDALKEGGLRRTKECGLAIDEFRSFFAAFSVLSYADRKFRYTRKEFGDYVTQARQITGMDVRATEFLGDLTQAICMFVRDGLEYTFAHRSFQEYFAAVYVMESNDEAVQSALLEQFVETISEDKVILLLHGMKPVLVERLLILPWIIQVRAAAAFDDSSHRESFRRFIVEVVDSFHRTGEGTWPSLVHGTPQHRTMHNAHMLSFVRAVGKFDTQVRRPAMMSRSDCPLLYDEAKKSRKSGLTSREVAANDALLNELAEHFIFNQATMISLFEHGDAMVKRHASLRSSVASILLGKASK